MNYILILFIIIFIYLILHYKKDNLVYINNTINKNREERKKNIINKIDKYNNNIENELNKIYNKTIRFISDSENVLSWNNINKFGNKIRIEKPQNKNNPSSLDLSNIQIWGTSKNNITKNWAKIDNSDKNVKQTKFKFSSIHNLNDIVNIDKTKQNPYFVEGKKIYKENSNKKVTDEVECNEGDVITSCTCYSDDGTCNGSKIITKNNKSICKAINRKKIGRAHV